MTKMERGNAPETEAAKAAHSVGRRDLLKGLTVAGVVAAGGYLLSEYTPWLNYDQQADHIRRPLEKAGNFSAQMRELVRYATLAASGHNTQPWKFVNELPRSKLRSITESAA